MAMMMDKSFKSRLGWSQKPVQEVERNGEKVEGGGGGEESVKGLVMVGSVVLVVIDVNKELSTSALDWALGSVVQKGDSVKLLGVLHHIFNPMGYKSRADENSWNGASRKVLDNELATHLAMYQSIPEIYTRVEKLGAKLEIEVRAHLHAKHLVVTEAKKLGARYVVIDRHIKKDKKYYIENLTCFVTRVKTVTNFEHLRHGVPEVEQASIAPEQHKKVLVAASKDRSAGILPSPERSVQAPATPPIPPQVQPPLPPPQFPNPQFSPGTPTSIVMSGVRPGDFYYDDSLTFESANYMPSGIVYGPELMGLAYENQMGVGFEGALNFQEMNAVRRWLTEPGLRVDPHFADPRFACGKPNLGHFADGHMMHQIPRPITPFTEAALADYMANLYSQPNPYSPQPPMSIRKDSTSTSTSTPQVPLSVPNSTKLYHSESVAKKASSDATKLRSVSSAAAELQRTVSDSSHSSPAPISVQPRRPDPGWAFDLLSLDVGNRRDVAASAGKQSNVAAKQVQEVENHQQAENLQSEKGNISIQAAAIDRSSSVRRAVSSKKHIPGTPPLCSLCRQMSPAFGKVKKFTFEELQEATNNFSQDYYLTEGGYGSVYKGKLKEGQLVAVKQHNLTSSQGDEEFCAEVEVLSCAQHRNLVTLIGYCVENHLRLLVYEYVCNGSLDRHLSSKSKTDLKWQYRHKIALGAARALRYLHEECRVGCVVHRDMRPNNILLTHDFTPMVGDFGLARRQSSGEEAEETRVLGTIGYLAPEYAETGKITDKADVYAFGVVLLELITGRKAIDYTRARNEVSLTDWARPLLDSYSKELVDPRLKMEYDEYELHCMMHAANQCVKKDPVMRPRMTQVLRILNPPQERDWAYGRNRGLGHTKENG